MEWVFDANGNPSIVDYQVRGYNVRRLRQSYSLSLDYDLADGHKLFSPLCITIVKTGKTATVSL